MKNRLNIFIFVIICTSFSTYACYQRSPRQLNRLAHCIIKHNGNQQQKQNKLVESFKNSTSSNKPYKPDVLQTIVTAVAHKNSFKPLEKKKTTINQAINEFHAVPGFLPVLSRVLEGARTKNTSHFNGALGELEAAVEKTKQKKTIVSFGRKILADDGRTLTEIDFEAEDEDGTITWQEIKTRNKLRKDDAKNFNAQRKKQKELAKKAGATHKLEIRFS